MSEIIQQAGQHSDAALAGLIAGFLAFARIVERAYEKWLERKKGPTRVIARLDDEASRSVSAILHETEGSREHRAVEEDRMENILEQLGDVRDELLKNRRH